MNSCKKINKTSFKYATGYEAESCWKLCKSLFMAFEKKGEQKKNKEKIEKDVATHMWMLQ